MATVSMRKPPVASRDGEFNGVDSCRAWLFRIMINTYRDQYRRQLRRPEVELVVSSEDGAVDDPWAADAPGPDLLAEAAFLREAIREAVSSLPPEVRVVVVLFFIEGMKYREIADIAGCPIGTVMSRLARGREMLRAALVDGWRVDANPSDTRRPKAGT